jgi:capsid protein
MNPVDEPMGAIIAMDGGFQTLQDICADQGLDYEEVLEQRKYEIAMFDDMGIPRPEWAGQAMASRLAQKPAPAPDPQKPEAQ